MSTFDQDSANPRFSVIFILMQSLRSIISDTLHFFYPHTCTGCGSDLLEQQHLLCLKCISDLPHTGFAAQFANPVERIFWGRIPVTAAHSEFYFSKGSIIQHLVHELKYKGNREIGVYLGELMAKTLLSSNRFEKIDWLVPLPLFHHKERKRGYNQAAVICEGLSKLMQVPVSTGNVTRVRLTETQTKKHRTERWQNVAGSFIVNDAQLLAGKHVLLVDDVITTGATMEACGQAIIAGTGAKLSMTALAMATK